VGCGLEFKENPPQSPQSMLLQSKNTAAGCLNAFILTPQLNTELYEQIISGRNSGHYVAVFYFASNHADETSEKIFTLLTEGGFPCFCIGENSLEDENDV